LDVPFDRDACAKEQAKHPPNQGSVTFAHGAFVSPFFTHGGAEHAGAFVHRRHPKQRRHPAHVDLWQQRQRPHHECVADDVSKFIQDGPGL
jgi:hypothetical protein